MKKSLSVVVLIIALSVIGGCLGSFESSDSQDGKIEENTYNDVVYDKAFCFETKDGLRSKYYAFFLFSESENKVIFCSHHTAGNGTNHFYSGTFEGSLDKSISLKMDGVSKLDGAKINFRDGKMYYNGDEYESMTVKEAIGKVKMYR